MHVFIMEFFLRLKDQDQHKDDYVMSKPWLKDGICLDLILLENQLPIHVLNELYEFVPKEKENPQGEKVCSICSIKKETGKECCTFLDLACKCGFFEPCPVCKCVCNPPKNPKSENECKHTPTKNAKHLTDLRRCFYIPKLPDSESESESDSDSGSDSFITYSATKLHDSGISFKAARERYSLDVNFKNHSCIFWLFSFITCFKITKALLQIPKLIIEDGTERELRNLIALEQCHYPDHSHICNYVSLIDDLIETKEDVDFLLDEKIIVNHLGSNDEAEKLVNSLCKELVMGPGLFQNQIKELNAHYENPFNRTMATLRSVYFKDLWRGSATIVGLAVLAFTFVNFFRPTHK
ncbi:hypothetical protein O6P43_017336 [Quillaja saponaria]|uniref:Uncharacterized protein n=1 Tax=Quillaja saponaria TaxID=32244 RepID=A0AAD7LPP6_QUISA|nr:hypothetical protein O6P43_017336 [Quillaja saponaria]